MVRLERERAVVQVYEETRGLAVGEPARGTGAPLMAQLGPGLLGGMFDGLQRPLDRLLERDGPFIGRGSSAASLDNLREWCFTPLKQPGDRVRAGELIGEVAEGPVRHRITAHRDGEIAVLPAGTFTLCGPVGSYGDGGQIGVCQEWPVRRPRPCRRQLAPTVPLVTGQRVVDLLYPLARGGTAIIPGGFGTGKTILEQSIAKFADVDLVVYVGCGERGNEMAELLEEFAALTDPWTGRRLMERTIVVANTSNMPVAAREASLYTAVTMAEYFRDQGCHVLLLADSISRWAEALREISSSLEEMPGEEGYPTYLASRMAGFMERAGVVETMDGGSGSLSMILSVSPPGGDFTEPVTQACLRTAGAFLMLDYRPGPPSPFPGHQLVPELLPLRTCSGPPLCRHRRQRLARGPTALPAAAAAGGGAARGGRDRRPGGDAGAGPADPPQRRADPAGVPLSERLQRGGRLHPAGTCAGAAGRDPDGP